ncbi:ermin [Melospiza georgiana]|uniref:ermin n=1 Tax=Melospiza georgiana TaxID=44398 RepID=UPI0025ACA4EB|nr:ermin [Melospiza georgiana]
MTEEAPAAATMPACNGSLPPPGQDGPLLGIGGLQETAKSLGTVPYANAETSPDTSPEQENLEENRNSLPEVATPENFAGEQRCQEKREESAGTPQRGPADVQDTGTNGQGSGEGPGGTAGTGTAGTGTAGTSAVPAAGWEAPESPAGSAEPRGNAAREAEEDEEDEDDTEEDEVQVMEMKKESSAAPRPPQRDKPPSPPGSPGRNSPLEKAGEPPALGKKNDISRHSYSRYNTISYRRIRKGNTKQRIDEFESMMHL